jgi:hypothetical protein
MSLNREVWKAEFTKEGTLPWLCPRCAVSRLRVRKETLFDGETRESKATHDHDRWEPEWIEGRFSCLMECAHCHGDIAVAGTYRVQDDRYHDPEHGDGGDYESYYRPHFFSESPLIIDIPSNTPLEVTGELEIAFRLFWGDPWACANRIRSSVEALLTAQRIQRTSGRIPANGKRQFLTLHARLLRFGKKQPKLAEALMAAKWLGNAGSHAAPLTPDDVLDGFEIVEHALDKLYSDREKRVGALSRAINRRKAPRSPRRSSRAR